MTTEIQTLRCGHVIGVTSIECRYRHDERCRQHQPERRRYIHDYNYVPNEPIFHGKGTKRFYGLELEVDAETPNVDRDATMM